MTSELQQDPEAIRTRAVWGVAVATAVLCAILVAIAWWLVVPGTPAAPTAASPLDNALFDDAHGGAQIRAADEARIHRYEWVDRTSRLVHIPIERAIDAAVTDPSLLRHRPPGVAQVPR